ncbi:magnesium and cobalt transport protein CorA [Microbacterium memoriense]|uniref:Magnesium and cobalt transport protein CorA n=1 Tax=Microbacterium memoriense TaxID=2978350 RepID=A0ABT2PBX9_9MICO|nr:magnesium and cobalt transport protein CorA [Microbacterium memoriense]MCT9001304.1 magnesium and cobalt transport protein CorA [Microbacterium memoriense]
MVAFHTVVYVDGKPALTDASPTEALAEARARDGLAWIGVTGATDDEVRALGSEFGLNRLGVLEALRGHQRSKFEQYGDDLFLVLQPARYDDASETVQCDEVDVFVSEQLVVAITRTAQVDLKQARARLEKHPEIFANGSLGVVWVITEFVTRGYRTVLDGVENDIDEIEEELFGERPDVSHRIFGLQREVIDLQHATAPLPDILDRLRELSVQRNSHLGESAFREVTDRARYVDGRVSGFRQTLDSALSIHATMVEQRRNEQMKDMTETSLQQNEQVKKISSWAAIGFAPTLIAGIYGMNFRAMPELDWAFGYPFAIGLMLAVSVGLYVVFKKNDWL